MKKEKYTSADILSALTLEARRLDISYAELSNRLKNSPVREQEIVKDYIKHKKDKENRKVEKCKGCSYNVRIPNRSGRMCSFSKTGFVRRRDKEGNCLEHTKENPKISRKPRRRRDAPTKFQRILDGDWHDKTVAEIAQNLGTSCDHVRQMMYDAKKKLGRDIPYKKVSSGRKAPDICVPKGITVTDKEAEYLALSKSGKSFTEIAAEKGVGVSTVSKALSKFKAKKD